MIGDQLDTAAGQVCAPGGLVHRLALTNTYPSVRVYSTDCGRDLYATDRYDAGLTTDPVDCPGCLGTEDHG